jgi:hypothetical protein
MTKPGDAQPAESSLAQLALDKLTRVLGAAQAQRVYAQTLAAIQLSDIRTPDELYTFGDQLSKGGGFEAAVGRLLTVAAVIRGASNANQAS